jgi:hypothetical protein
MPLAGCRLLTGLPFRVPPDFAACASLHVMADPMPPVVQDLLDHAWESAQRLAIDVIEYPADKRDELMRRMGILFTDVARDAGCTHEVAREFGATMERSVRDYGGD